MTDTLRIGAIRAACDAQTEAVFDDKPSGRCAYPACEAKGQRCKLRAVGVDAAIAFIAAWALEPAQAEKAAIAIATTDSADRDHERGAERWAGWDGELKEPYFDFARAAIAALFGEPK